MNLTDEQIRAAWERTEVRGVDALWHPLLSRMAVRIKPEPREVWVSDRGDLTWDEAFATKFKETKFRRYREVIEARIDGDA